MLAIEQPLVCNTLIIWICNNADMKNKHIRCIEIIIMKHKNIIFNLFFYWQEATKKEDQREREEVSGGERVNIWVLMPFFWIRCQMGKLD